MSLNKTKCDPELGLAVQAHLESIGLATPMVPNGLSAKQKVTKIEKHFTEIMNTLGLDLTDDSLMETPLRIAKMFTNEVFWGLEPENFPKCTAVGNKMNYDEMLIEKNVSVKSFCEHHWLPLVGTATIAYFPSDKVLGISKLSRVVEYYSRRPQIQERLTEQIYHALCFILGTDDVAVLIDAEHSCVSMRGAEDDGASTITSKLGGKFRTEPGVRSEFMHLSTYK